MPKNKAILLLFSIFILIPITNAHAETDELGYQYTKKKASEIDFADGDFFIVLLSGDPYSENAIYALYDNSEIEKYEKDINADDGLSNLEDSTQIGTFAALPTKFSQYYSSSKWIKRSTGMSLSLNPKKPAWQTPPGMAGAHLQKYRWDVVYKKHGKSKNWKHTASMKAQLHCHADYPKKLKTPWNIEPWRTTSNYAKVVAKACNPPVGF